MSFSTGALNLQATLSASSAGSSTVNPHHPITCTGDLRYEEDGTFACPHASVDAYDSRTQHCLDHSIALLLLEEASRL